jgi:hypothetical protein
MLVPILAGTIIGLCIGIPIGMIYEDLFDKMDLRGRKPQ